MTFTVRELNKFLLFKLPSAFFTGVRISAIDQDRAEVKVKHRWINQNPFHSLYYGVQAMAAELATGVLVMKKIQESQCDIAMLVVKQSAVFTKKGKGIISFSCTEGSKIDAAVKTTMETGEGQTFVLCAQAVNEKGEQISSFDFEWSIKRRRCKR